MRVLKWLAPLLLLVSVAACEYQITQYPEQPKVSQVGSATHSFVQLVEMPGFDELQKKCKPHNGLSYACAEVITIDNNPATMCTIYIVPLDKADAFNKVVFLALIGHELLHCFLWMH